MPYIITTKRIQHPQSTAARAGFDPIKSRRAVATLDEAQRAVAGALAAYNVLAEGMGDPAAYTPEERAQADEAVSGQGGAVGPLPDGTMIEVERVELTTLAVGWQIALTDEPAIIDAYNAAQQH